MSQSFKNHKFPEAEKLWLQEVYKTEEFDPRVAKVKLIDRLPRDFNPMEIDKRFLINGKILTIIGIWYVDSESVILKQLETVILAIKELLLKKLRIETVTAKEIAKNTGIEELQVEIALRNLGKLGSFFSSASRSSEAKGYSKIGLTGDNAYDQYLKFTSLENLMEEYYNRPTVNVTSTVFVPTENVYSHLTPEKQEEKESDHSEISKDFDKKKVFIVHGNDNSSKLEVSSFIKSLGFEPIILHEQASGGATIIEKIENYSNVGFGVVLYTPCDLGAKNEKNLDLSSRARQNVVFEHGYLIGKLKRGNVCVLVKGKVETPNDISGVVYINLDNSGAWKNALAKELEKAGFAVDMNKSNKTLDKSIKVDLFK
jgi:predicted nucleotide-binding protein